MGRCGARCPRRTRVPLRHLSRVSCTRSSTHVLAGRRPTTIADVSEAVRKRFAETAPAIAEIQDRRAAETEERLTQLLDLSGEERALDVGTGAGALALATGLARPGRDRRRHRPRAARGGEEARAGQRRVRRTATPTSCRSRPDAFDLVSTARTLHHVQRPELVLAEMNRVLRPGGTMLVVDQLAPNDPLAAIELNRFERARDESTTRILADVDLRGLFDSNGLVLRRSEVVSGGARPRELPRPRGLPRRRARERALAGADAPNRSTTAGTCSRSRSSFDLEGGLSRGTPSASNERMKPMALITPSASAR